MEEVCFNKHQVTFQLTEKVNVNGKRTHPIYKFLKNAKKDLFFSFIRWNFTKFLIDQKGNVVKRYGPKVLPENIEDDIRKLLAITP
jgi:glutathione peroxidase